jgi:hypothetical protein
MRSVLVAVRAPPPWPPPARTRARRALGPGQLGRRGRAGRRAVRRQPAVCCWPVRLRPRARAAAAPAARPSGRRAGRASAPSRLQGPRPRPQAGPRATLPQHLDLRSGRPAAPQQAPLRPHPAPSQRLAWRAPTGDLAPRRWSPRLLPHRLRLVWRARAGRLMVLRRPPRRRRPRFRRGLAAGLRRRCPRGGRRPAAARPGSPRAPARRRRDAGSQPGGAGRPPAA